MALVSFFLRCAMLGFACIVLFAQVLPGQTSPDTKSSQELRKFIAVDDSTTVIQERSVSLLSSLQVSQNLGMTRRQGFSGGDMLPDMQAEMPNGATYYVFQLKPKERLNVNVACEVAGMVWLQFIKPAVSDAMAPALRRANMAPKNLRAKRIEIKNILDKPYEIVLVAYGQVNYQYTLKIERKL